MLIKGPVLLFNFLYFPFIHIISIIFLKLEVEVFPIYTMQYVDRTYMTGELFLLMFTCNYVAIDEGY